MINPFARWRARREAARALQERIVALEKAISDKEDELTRAVIRDRYEQSRSRVARAISEGSKVNYIPTGGDPIDDIATHPAFAYGVQIGDHWEVRKPDRFRESHQDRFDFTLNDLEFLAELKIATPGKGGSDA